MELDPDGWYYVPSGTRPGMVEVNAIKGDGSESRPVLAFSAADAVVFAAVLMEVAAPRAAYVREVKQ